MNKGAIRWLVGFCGLCIIFVTEIGIYVASIIVIVSTVNSIRGRGTNIDFIDFFDLMNHDKLHDD